MKQYPLKILNSRIEKQIEKFIILFVFSFGMFVSAHSQFVIKNVASAVISANIVSDITGITQFEELNFKPSGCTGESCSVAGTAAFNIIGNQAYSISFSTAEVFVAGNNTSEAMKISDFTIVSKTSPAPGVERLIIGAVLNTNAQTGMINSMPASPVEITVNYN
jgi:hypothetical protein